MSTDLDQYTREDLADMIADEQKENTRLTSRLAEVEKERDELLKRREAERFDNRKRRHHGHAILQCQRPDLADGDDQAMQTRPAHFDVVHSH